ncbi:MAG TPA: hypothetical protein VNJ71_13010 [Gemmatimonadales bacterium]|nr:hypothetical protein [Gemmatimonadales bacterium]
MPVHTVRDLVRAATAVARRTAQLVTPVLLPLLAYALFRWTLDLAATVHVAFGAALATVLALLVVVLITTLTRALRRHLTRHPGEDAVHQFLLTVLLAVALCAWVSYALYLARPESYGIPGSTSIATFADFYGWVFLDMLPLLRVSETLRLTVPLEPLTLAARLPVLGFRVLVLAAAVETVLVWRGAVRRDTIA